MDGPTCTLKTPQMGDDVALRALWKMASASSRLPSTNVMLGDLAASFAAEGEEASRVSARI